MPQKEIELILTRQLASYLAVPAVVIDLAGEVVYFNEAAEPIVGRRFDETDEMPIAMLRDVFAPMDEAGNPLPPQALPLTTALTERRPVHQTFWIVGMDGLRRHIELTALPLLGQAHRPVGVLATFWELA